MEEPELTRAVAAAVAVAASVALPADDAVVVFSSNKVALRITPCDVLARVTRAGAGDPGLGASGLRDAELELHRARRLADAGCPVGDVQPGVAPRVHEHDGFAVTLWTYHDPSRHPVAAEDYAHALARLHEGMRTVDLRAPRFTDRIEEAQAVVADPALSPDLAETDRRLLGDRLAELSRTIGETARAEQLLHGEPHPGNVLGTAQGAVFIDFETLCRGPVELDLAHVPEAVCAHYPGADQELLAACRQLVLAMIATWRWSVGDQFPNRQYWRHALLHALREGLPWPAPAP